MRLGAVFAVAVLVTAPAFAQEGEAPSPTATEEDYAAVVDKTVGDYIIPAYAALYAATRGLSAEVEGYCAAPDEEKRAAIAGGFDGTVTAWAGVDFLRFGPMARESRYERFAFFPDVHGTGARQLRRFLAGSDQALLESGALAKQSAAVQGLPALESLLYSDSKALVGADAPEPYRCALTLAVARNMDAIAGEALAGWQGDASWADLMRVPGAVNPVYRTPVEAMTEVLKAILTGLEQMRDHRLQPALGGSAAKAKASRAPYAASGLALTYLSASAEAIERFVHASGILGLLPEAHTWIAGSVDFEFSNLKRALEAAGPDLEAALADPEKRGKLEYAAVVLASLRDLFQTRLAPAAGLTAGFNSLDGD